MIGAAQVEQLLRAWGREFGGSGSMWPGPQEMVSPTAAVMASAPGRHQQVTRRDVAYLRTALRHRVVTLGESEHNQRVMQLKPWAVDPIRGRQDRAARADSWHPSPVAEAVELAALALYRFDAIKGVVLRLEYCAYGVQAEKAERAGEIVGQPIKLRRYRGELDLARVWMAGRLSDELAA